MTVAFVGGSTPYVAAFIEALRNAATPSNRLVLHGRNRDALAVVSRFACSRLARLDWDVTATLDLDEALTGARVVVHQPRYGDLGGRAADERLAGSLGVPADETLGPGGLQAALRAAPDVAAFAERVHRRSPDALVLNLANPLSVTTALLARTGVPVLGLCELPIVTVRRAASLLGLRLDDVTWAYVGLNHRGFVHVLRAGADDLLPALAKRLPDRSALGVLGTEVAALGALPLKYHGLFAGDAPHGTGRAAELAEIRARILSDLARNPAEPPSSLALRDMPWWAESVVPVLSAALTGIPIQTVVNVVDGADVVREVRAVVTGRRVQRLRAPGPPAPVQKWMARFVRHEVAVLDAVTDPSPVRIRTALALDPLVPANRVDGGADRLADAIKRTGGNLRRIGLV